MRSFAYTVFAIVTAVIGYHMHNSIFFAIMDLCLAPLVWLKWLLFHEINITIIKGAFDFFMK